jgi:DNA-binding GntR family transcriptional regulator
MRCVESIDPCPVEDFVHLHYQFDAVIAEAAGNRVLLEIFRSLRKAEQEAHKKVLNLPEAVENSNRHHEAILKAMVEHDPVAAEQAAKQHFASIEPLLKNWKDEDNGES